MLAWISNNIGTILAFAVLLAVVMLIILKMVRNRKKGRTSCGCGCAHCAMADMCHASRTASRKQS